MNSYLAVLKKYAVFTGRASRSEYWIYVLINAIIFMVLWLISKDLYLLCFLALLLPSISVFIRRLHDTNHSGWWTFLALIPFVGAIILLVWLCSDSAPSVNKYGPSPKASALPPAVSISSSPLQTPNIPN